MWGASPHDDLLHHGRYHAHMVIDCDDLVCSPECVCGSASWGAEVAGVSADVAGMPDDIGGSCVNGDGAGPA